MPEQMSSEKGGEQEIDRGLGAESKKRWPKFSQADARKEPIELLAPNTARHDLVLDYLRTRIEGSERRMSTFYERWDEAALAMQTYIPAKDAPEETEDYEDNEKGRTPKPTEIVVPYTLAAVQTITTHLMQTFFGRDPAFQLISKRADSAEAARHMETILQYQMQRARVQWHFRRAIQDGQVYGVGINRVWWEREEKFKTVLKTQTDQMGNVIGRSRSRELRLSYEGNRIESVSPFDFLPDPYYPMSEVATEGEFVFARSYVGRHQLKQLEADQVVHYIDYVPETLPAAGVDGLDSQRSNFRFRSHGYSLDDGNVHDDGVTNLYQLDRGTIVIIPAELGLGAQWKPERWLFTIANKSQIIQAVPFDADYDAHPFIVQEPQEQGLAFGHPGTVDFLKDIQYVASWLLNTHVFNVRAALNNMFVYDPTRIDTESIIDTGAGKLIQALPAAYGEDLGAAIKQLRVEDVTGNHIKDLNAILRIGDELSAVSDNMRGIQDDGSRKTATEVRTGFEAALSRLSDMARLISVQAFVPLGEMMSSNTQQYMSEEFVGQLLGATGLQDIAISPEQVVGDYYVRTLDGTLPVDKQMGVMLWQQLFQTVAGHPVLSQVYNLPLIFEHVAELAGAPNIKNMKVMPDEQVASLLQQQRLLNTQGGAAKAQAPGGGAPEAQGSQGVAPDAQLGAMQGGASASLFGNS